MRSFKVPSHGELLAGTIGAIEFEVARGDGIHLAAAMRAAGYQVAYESTRFDGPDKITARLRRGPQSLAPAHGPATKRP